MTLPVSIVVCTYNDHHFLPKCLESCAGQNCQEIILVDDGSSHELSPDLWQTVRAHRIEYVRLGENRGLAAARNAGFGLARSEWVIPLDADDWFYGEPGCGVRPLVEATDSRDDCVVGNLTECGSVCKPPMAAKADSHGRCALTREDWLSGNMGFSTTLIRRSIFSDEHIHYDGSRKEQYEDWKFFIRLWKRGKFWRYVPAKVYCHTVRPDGMLRRMDLRREEFRKIATEEL